MILHAPAGEGAQVDWRARVPLAIRTVRANASFNLAVTPMLATGMTGHAAILTLASRTRVRSRRSPRLCELVPLDVVHHPLTITVGCRRGTQLADPVSFDAPRNLEATR